MNEQLREFTGLWIPKHIIEDKELSMSEIIIYAEISCFEVCYKSNESLGDRYGLKNRRISEIINKLEKKGYIKRHKFDGRNRQIIAIKDLPSARQTSKKMLGRLAEKCHADTQKNATIEYIEENKKNISITENQDFANAKTNSVSDNEQYGNELVNYFIETLKTKMRMPSLDDTIKNNRQFAFLLINKFKKQLESYNREATNENIKQGFNSILDRSDEFHKNKMTKISYIYYNFNSIINSIK